MANNNIEGTDTFLVNRSGTSYQIEAKDLMAKLQDDDLMLVNRGGTSYKAVGSDIIESLKPAIVEAPTVYTPADGAGLIVTAQTPPITDIQITPGIAWISEGTEAAVDGIVPNNDGVSSKVIDVSPVNADLGYGSQHGWLMFDGDDTTWTNWNGNQYNTGNVMEAWFDFGSYGNLNNMRVKGGNFSGGYTPYSAQWYQADKTTKVGQQFEWRDPITGDGQEKIWDINPGTNARYLKVFTTSGTNRRFVCYYIEINGSRVLNVNTVTKLYTGDAKNIERFLPGDTVVQEDSLATAEVVDVVSAGTGSYISVKNTVGTFVTNKKITGQTRISPDSAVGTTPTCTCSPPSIFNDTFSSTDWEIATDFQFNNVVSSVYNNSDPTYWVADPALVNNNTYYIRVRHRSTSGVYSDWSSVNEFKVALEGVKFPTLPGDLRTFDKNFSLTKTSAGDIPEKVINASTTYNSTVAISTSGKAYRSTLSNGTYTELTTGPFAVANKKACWLAYNAFNIEADRALVNYDDGSEFGGWLIYCGGVNRTGECFTNTGITPKWATNVSVDDKVMIQSEQNDWYEIALNSSSALPNLVYSGTAETGSAKILIRDGGNFLYLTTGGVLKHKSGYMEIENISTIGNVALVSQGSHSRWITGLKDDGTFFLLGYDSNSYEGPYEMTQEPGKPYPVTPAQIPYNQGLASAAVLCDDGSFWRIQLPNNTSNLKLLQKYDDTGQSSLGEITWTNQTQTAYKFNINALT